MIVHFIEAEERLIESLELVECRSVAWRVVHVCATTKGGAWGEELLQDVVNSLQAVTTDEHAPQCFFCNDGHIFVLVRGMRMQGLKSLERRILSVLNQRPERFDILSQILDLSVKWLKLFGFAQELSRKNRKFPDCALSIADGHVEKVLRSVDRSHTSRLLEMRKNRGGLHVLVAEDDEFTQQMISSMLRQCKLIKAVNGSEVLSKYCMYVPDMVLLDINLPLIDGHRLLKEIRTFDPEAYVVMLSGNSQMDNVMRSMDNGAKGFVAKPFPREKLHNYTRLCALMKEAM